jgi:hypothetical protein
MLVLGEGTNAGIFQSIMVKPPNARNVYPLGMKEPKEVSLPDSFKEAMIIKVFNIENHDTRDLANNTESLKSLL